MSKSSKIVSKPPTKEYKDNWERIFGKKKTNLPKKDQKK